MSDTMGPMTGGLCRTCGEAIHPGDQFCGNCGASVGGPTGDERQLDVERPPVKSIPNPIAVAQMPTVPPPVGVAAAAPVTAAVIRTDATVQGTDPDVVGDDAKERRRGGRGFRIITGAVVVVLVAVIAGLTLTLVARNTDLDNERAKLAQAQAALATSATTTTEPASGASTPVDSTVDPLVEVQNQLNQVTAALEQAKADLTAEKQGRVDDAAAAQAAAQAAATQASSEVAAAQAAQAAAEQQAAATAGLFPLSVSTIASANPNGAYTATLTPGECTLALCSTLAPLSVSIAEPLAISGDRVSGTLAFDGTTYTNGGPLELAKSPQCASVDQASTYLLSLHTTAITVVDGVVQAAEMQGTYSEVITAGDCAGQHRSYTVTMDRD